MANDKELQEFVPGIMETREQFEARRQAVRNNPNPTMSELASVGMDDSTDADEMLAWAIKFKAEREAERNKAIAEAEDQDLREFVPGILETREQLIARRQAVLNNPNPTMSELASVGMDDSFDAYELTQELAQHRAAKEAERNKAIAEAVLKPKKE